MNGEERVYSVLVVSCAEKYNTALLDMLPGSKYGPVKVTSSVSEAKRAFAEYAYDFIIINSPLPDDPGTRFAADCCRSGGSVALLLLKSDVLEQTYFRAVSHGVFTLRKPTSKTTVLLALDWMTAARERLRVLEDKGRSVEERMEEIRTVNRAKRAENDRTRGSSVYREKGHGCLHIKIRSGTRHHCDVFVTVYGCGDTAHLIHRIIKGCRVN